MKRGSGGSCTLGMGGVHWARAGATGGKRVDERPLLLRKGVKRRREEERSIKLRGLG